ncbi:hypothetical protein K491DRAFT_722157 [Lophiostoma macrostomum CBS 122681]|uniref:Uncharacterized protein n=1 Tax=Lophiostoma macrostomum CBS 122681 TaxID=1314788 RepID=A0A6A6SQL8_9PLEO|nr:hypothetical protein K491DRAFT_722157 [Lophiostoma macrostomum CBS 122681]
MPHPNVTGHVYLQRHFLLYNFLVQFKALLDSRPELAGQQATRPSCKHLIFVDGEKGITFSSAVKRPDFSGTVADVFEGLAYLCYQGLSNASRHTVSGWDTYAVSRYMGSAERVIVASDIVRTQSSVKLVVEIQKMKMKLFRILHGAGIIR